MTDLTPGLAVYIDPMDVYYYRGEMVDINHYYPYGLSFNKSTSSPLVENIHLYQTKKQDKTNKLYLDDFHARQYDPQLGRFQSLDPPNQFSSGYTGMGNKPSNGIDPDGMTFWDDISDGWKNTMANIKGGVGVKLEQQWKINKGLFKVDENRHFINFDFNENKRDGFSQLVSRFSWEYPQTLVGHVSATYHNAVGHVSDVSHYRGGTAVTLPGKDAAFASGCYLIGNDKDEVLHADPSNQLFMHEYGHYLQSQELGPMYFTKVGIPSLASDRDKIHVFHPIEQDASRRGHDYFKDDPGFNWTGIYPTSNAPNVYLETQDYLYMLHSLFVTGGTTFDFFHAGVMGWDYANYYNSIWTW
jgi:RHS repeat-associated protein